MEVADIDSQQTLLVLPIGFLKQFTPEHKATFQELASDMLLLSMVGPDETADNKAYKLVPAHGSFWVSVPRPWLRNVGAEKGDQVFLYASDNPRELLVHFRPKSSLP